MQSRFELCRAYRTSHVVLLIFPGFIDSFAFCNPASPSSPFTTDDLFRDCLEETFTSRY